jgi:hypothetical protein
MSDEALTAAADRGESWFAACAWLGGLYDVALREVAEHLTSDGFMDTPDDLDWMRLGLPADLGMLTPARWEDGRIATFPVSVDCEAARFRTADGSTVSVTMRLTGEGWRVIAVGVEPPTALSPSDGAAGRA